MGGDENEEKRLRVKLEILTTERSYVADISTAIEVFMKPLYKNAQDGGVQAVATRDEISTLFGNLESVLFFNQQLLQALEEEHANTGQSSIGQIFIEMAPYLRMYCIYVNGHTRATELFQTMMDRNQKKEMVSPFAQFLMDCAERFPDRVRGRQLTDLLIMPIQRVPRYRLLLEELLKRTPPGEDYDTLEMGLAKIADVANLVNERLRDFENRMMVLKVQKRFGNVASLVEPHRLFVMEGTLQKMCRKGPKDYVFVLFSDLLVYGVPATILASIAGTDEDVDQPVTFKRKIELASSSLSSVSATSFQVSSPTKSFLVIAPDATVKNTWYTAIEQCMSMCNARAAETDGGASVVNGSSSGVDDHHAPLWVPDKDAPNCQMPECGVKFTLLNRRHHCRSCGQVVCAECSPHRWHLPNIDKMKPQRICHQCYMEIRSKLEEDNFESAGSVNAPRPAPPPSTRSSPAAAGSFFPLKAAGGILSRLSWTASTGSPSPKPSAATPTSATSSISNSTVKFSHQSTAAKGTDSSGGNNEDLPRNWRTLKDEHGRTYYWHVITDMVTYDRPTGRIKTGAFVSSDPPSSQTRSSSTSGTKPTPGLAPSSPLRPSTTAAPSTTNQVAQSLNRTSLTVDTKQSSGSSPPLTSASQMGRLLGSVSPKSGLIPPGSPLNGSTAQATAGSTYSGATGKKSTPGSLPATSSTLPTPVNAAANANPQRRTSMKGPSLAERLASLSEQGVFGDPKMARFSSKGPSPRSKSVDRAKLAPGATMTSSPLLASKLYTSSSSAPPPSTVSQRSLAMNSGGSKLPSPKPHAATIRAASSTGSASTTTIRAASSTGSSSNVPVNAASRLASTPPSSSSSAGKYSQQYSSTLNASSSSKPVEVSQLNDAEFFRHMGVFRSEYEKLSSVKKAELKRSKNAV